MIKYYLFIITMICCTLQAVAQPDGAVGKKHIHKNVQYSKLLVLEYKELSDEDIAFNTKSISKDQIHAFVSHENKHLADHNKKLKETFQKAYKYQFELVSEEDISGYSVDEYPYILYRTVVKKVKNHDGADHGHFTYSYYFYNRKTGKKYNDINIHHTNRWHSLRIVLLELNDYLSEVDID